MTDQQHPVTPGPGLLQDWYDDSSTSYKEDVIRAAQWGADQELQACLSWLQARIREGWNPCHLEDLRTARRPKPPSLKEQALDELVAAERLYPADWSTIRRALETLPE
jgi:hypothetical protein